MTGRFGCSYKDTHIAEQRSLLFTEQALYTDATAVIGVEARNLEQQVRQQVISHKETGRSPPSQHTL